MDITRYITNWSKLYEVGKDKLPIVDQMGRDFIRKAGVVAKLDEAVLLADLMRMTRYYIIFCRPLALYTIILTYCFDGCCSIRLRAQDAMGVQVVCESAIGMGIFAGDAIGIGDRVRTLSAMALRKVLEQDSFHCIKVILFALPVFKPKRDNYHWYVSHILTLSSTYMYQSVRL
jgi:hypothetical protein